MKPGAAAVFAIVCLLCPPAAARPDAKDLRPLADLVETIRENYSSDPALTTQGLVDEALSGMVSSLDPYSEFLNTERYRDLQEDTRGSFSGIGIEIGIVNDKLQVIAPIEGTPADRAGLDAGDIIAYIDGVPTDDMNIMDAVHRIKGPTGTVVTLTIFREGEPPRDVPIKRGKITPVNIRHRMIGDVGYVAIRGFSQNTAEGLRERLEEFEKRGAKSVILDLRSNPGGLLEEARKVAEMFLPVGRKIVSTEGRDPRQRMAYYATGREGYFEMSLAVLINEGSASGSEIVAGALQDWGRAIIVGRRSFGKASVQSIEPLGKGDTRALRMTVAHYYTPRHREISGVGIVPDVTLPVRYFPSTVRRLEQEGYLKRYAQYLAGREGEAKSGLGLRLSRKALENGLIEMSVGEGLPAPDSEQGDRLLADDFRRWALLNIHWFTGEEWDEYGNFAVQRIRIAVMREIKGEESARRYSVEFDEQVRAAATLLKFAGNSALERAAAR